MGAATDDNVVASICPDCGLGEIEKHCQPGNCCGWMVCEFRCGYAVSLATGIVSHHLSRQQRGVGYADDGGDQDTGEAEDDYGPYRRPSTTQDQDPPV